MHALFVLIKDLVLGTRYQVLGTWYRDTTAAVVLLYSYTGASVQNFPPRKYLVVYHNNDVSGFLWFEE